MTTKIESPISNHICFAVYQVCITKTSGIPECDHSTIPLEMIKNLKHSFVINNLRYSLLRQNGRCDQTVTKFGKVNMPSYHILKIISLKRSIQFLLQS